MEDCGRRMDVSQEAAAFILASFRSVWTLELLLNLRQSPDRAFSNAELVTALRASDPIVSSGIESLIAAGLVADEGEGRVRYAPASKGLEEKVQEAEKLYRIKPDAVRRLIVRGTAGGLAAFADSFKLWGK